MVHLTFNVLGMLFFVSITPQFADFVRYISSSARIGGSNPTCCGNPASGSERAHGLQRCERGYPNLFRVLSPG